MRALSGTETAFGQREKGDMSIIIATHWVRNDYERCLQSGETRRFGTRRAAELWAASVIKPVVTTNDCYWRDVGRAESVGLEVIVPLSRRVNAYERVGTIEAEVVIVPSVGELGWTP